MMNRQEAVEKFYSELGPEGITLYAITSMEVGGSESHLDYLWLSKGQRQATEMTSLDVSQADMILLDIEELTPEEIFALTGSN